MEKYDNDLFKDWTDFLKSSFGISVTAIGKRIDLSKSLMNAYRNGPTPPKKEHFTALAKAFPELTEKALQVGLTLDEIEATPGSVGTLEARLAKVEQQLDQENERLKELNDTIRSIQDQINKGFDNQDQKDQTIKRLLDIIEKNLTSE